MARLLLISPTPNVFLMGADCVAEEPDYRIVGRFAWNDETLLEIDRHEPDLLLLDGEGYGPTALTICRSLKSNSDTRIIPLMVNWPATGVSSIATLIDAGADAAVTADWSPAMVRLHCRVLLRLRSYHREHRYRHSQLLRQMRRTRQEADRVQRTLQAVMNGSEAMMLLLSVEGVIRQANRETCAALGQAESDLIGRNWFNDCVAEGGRSVVVGAFNRMKLAPGQAEIELEHAIVLQNRQERWLKCHYSLLTAANGQLAGLILSAQDMTHARRVESALQDSEIRYETMAKILPVGMFRTDSRGHYLYVNERWKQITGLDLQQVWEQFWIDSVGPLDQIAIRQAWHSFRQNRGPFRHEFRFCSQPGGGEVWVFGQIVAETGSQGQITGYLGVISDISERRRAEQMLRHYENTVESSEDMLVALDRDYRFVIANQAFLRYFGLRRQDVIGQKATEILGLDEFAKTMMPTIDLGIKGKFVQFERTLDLPGMGRRHLSESMFPMTNGAGEVCGIVASIRDITDSRTIERKLADYQKQLKKLSSKLAVSEERERRRIAVELHDRISQTLVFAKMKVDWLIDKTPVPSQRVPLSEVAHLIHETLDNVHRITHELSYPILYEMGFEAAVSAWSADHIEKKHHLAVRILDDGQPKPLEDEVRLILFRAARELLNNVVKHARATQVTVHIGRLGDQIELIVEDDGVGFGGQDRLSQPELGSGFGLFDIRERIEQAQGRLTIHSSPGHGSKIMVRAPLKTVRTNDSRQAEGAASQDAGRSPAGQGFS